MKKRYGKVWLVGAGPGCAELLTIKALRIIRIADAIVYDRLIDRKILSFAKKRCRLYYAGKEKGHHLMEQEDINHLLLGLASIHKNVVRLKGGDPLIFARGWDEIEFLVKRGVRVEVVPGVSSITGVPAWIGLPLTIRGVSSSFAVVTGHEDPLNASSIKWDVIARMPTIVIVMGVSHLRNIAERLIQEGRSPQEHLAIIENGCTPHQKITIHTLEDVAAGKFSASPPALIIIGKVVTEYAKLTSQMVKKLSTHTGLSISEMHLNGYALQNVEAFFTSGTPSTQASKNL